MATQQTGTNTVTHTYYAYPCEASQYTLTLYDGNTNDEIGPATIAQIEASAHAPNGLILIDEDGDVTTEQERYAVKRLVYVV